MTRNRCWISHRLERFSSYVVARLFRTLFITFFQSRTAIKRNTKGFWVMRRLEISSRLQTNAFLLQLPDGRMVKVGGERFEAPEVLFQPHLIDVEGVGISEMLFNCIQTGDIGAKTELFLSTCTSRHSSRVLQAHRVVRRLDNVPGSAQSSRA